MKPNKFDATNTSIEAWRTSVINVILLVGTVVALIGTVMSALDARTNPEQWPAVVIYAAMLPVFAVFAFFRKINLRIRTWSFLVAGYLIGLTTLFSLGLGGSGRLYLLVLPIIALVLLGMRSGILMSVVSILTLLVFVILSRFTTLLARTVDERSSFSLNDWLAEGSNTLLLVITMVILILFYRLQKRSILKEKQSQAELAFTHKLLEQQNSSLEETVQNKTREYQQSNENLVARNAELGLLNELGQALTKTLDVRTVTRIAGDHLRSIFDSDGVSIMLVDEQTSLIHATSTSDGIARRDDLPSLSPPERLTNVITFTNEYIADIHGEANMFATVFAGIMDVHGNTLHYINCGNEPPLLIRSGRVVTTLPPTGPVIGIIPGSRFETAEISIEPGDTLLAFTDGLTDSKNTNDEFFGTSRLVETIQAVDAAHEKLLDGIYRRLLSFTGTNEQFDDITMLTMRRVC